jgi:hypothetical protein
VPAAFVVDLARARRWSPVVAGVLFAVALHVAYVPVRNWIGDGVFFDAEDVAVGGALTLVVATAVFWLAAVTRDGRASPLRGPTAGGLAAVLAVAIAVGAAAEARAHDPGQGEDAGTVALRVTADGDRVALRAGLPVSACKATEPVAVVARRAGETVRGPLTKTGCRFEGALTVPDRGRWFVYAEMRRDGRSRAGCRSPQAAGEHRTSSPTGTRTSRRRPRTASSRSSAACCSTRRWPRSSSRRSC